MLLPGHTTPPLHGFKEADIPTIIWRLRCPNMSLDAVLESLCFQVYVDDDVNKGHSRVQSLGSYEGVDGGTNGNQ